MSRAQSPVLRLSKADTSPRSGRHRRPASRTGDYFDASGPNPLDEPSCMESLRPRLLSLARRQLEDFDDCEDACQETLLRTWTAMQKGKCPPAAIAPYAFGTLRNVIRELRRARRRELRWNGTDSPDPAPDPASGLASKEVSKTVRTALEELPPEQQRVAMLTLMDDVSCTEVARTEGAAPATIRQRKVRARKTLFEQLRVLKAG